jgi:phosphate/sulfate permease
MSDLIGSGRLRLDDNETAMFRQNRRQLMTLVEHVPLWVVVSTAVSLGLGTMIGWKRIVVTVGEKIGRAPLTYSQGACAQLVTAATIALGNATGLPVSTTHVLSSAVAGTMVSNQSGLQAKTVRDIGMTWLFTFPCAMLLSAALFVILRALLGVFG